MKRELSTRAFRPRALHRFANRALPIAILAAVCGQAMAQTDITLDNSAAAVVGTWTTSTFEGNFLGSNYAVARSGGTADTMTWTPNLPTAGDYHVFIRLPNGSQNRAAAAQFTVAHAGGATQVDVNQTLTDGGRWVGLGRYAFAAGTAGHVSLSDSLANGANNIPIIGDAVRFISADTIIDNPEATLAGTWNLSTSQPNFHGDNYATTASGTGADTATYTPRLLGSGDYNVYYKVPNGDGTRLTNVSLTVNHALGSNSYQIDQTVAAGGDWILLGNHQFHGGTSGNVVISDTSNDAQRWVIADAIRFDARTLTDNAFNVALNATASASSVHETHVPANAVDGDTANGSRWLSATGAASPHWLALDLGVPQQMQCAVIYNGYNAESGLDNVKLQTLEAGTWVDIPGTTVNANTANVLTLEFDQIVEAQNVRLLSESTNRAKIKDIELYSNNGTCPNLGESPEVLVNQSGYDVDMPKRFTAPTATANAAFEVRNASTQAVVFSGTLDGQRGDFSAFKPDTPSTEYVVVVGGLESDPFRIAQNWYERVS